MNKVSVADLSGAAESATSRMEKAQVAVRMPSVSWMSSD